MQFPAGWMASYPDQERVLLAIIQPALDALDPGGVAVTWLPDDLAGVLDAGKVVVRVHRVGGGLHDRVLDTGTLQVAVIASTRATSWQALSYLRDVLIGAVDTDISIDGQDVHVGQVDEMSGPIQIPELNPDERLVQAMFAVTCRKVR